MYGGGRTCVVLFDLTKRRSQHTLDMFGNEVHVLGWLLSRKFHHDVFVSGPLLL